MGKDCEAPRCQQEAECRWREPGTGVEWSVCREHLARCIAAEVLKEERIELACDTDPQGFAVVSVVRSWSPSFLAASRPGHAQGDET